MLTNLLVDLQGADVPITPDNVRPGWVALGIVFALGVALVFLVRSMARHLKKASQPWEGEVTEEQAEDVDSTSSS